MVATTTPRIHTLNKHIQADFGAYIFVLDDVFYWSPGAKAIHHPTVMSEADIWSLLHEIAHAELGHQDYSQDIQLLSQEVAAWEHASGALAPRYGAQIDDNHIQDHLDTYRLWLHKRSTCPACGHIGLQNTNTYSCNNCRCLWQANDARLCRLKRIKLQAQGRSA